MFKECGFLYRKCAPEMPQSLRPPSSRGVTLKGLFMGEDPDHRRTQAVCGEVPRLIPADPPAEGHNLSEHRQKAEALRNNEETIRVLLNAAPTAAFMIDTQGIVLYEALRQRR